MLQTVESTWEEQLTEEFTKSYFTELMRQVKTAYQSKAVFPPQDRVFAALSLCPFPAVKVVILGQDPYHGAGQAEGLSFSVPEKIKLPPSLRNIYKELRDDVGINRGTNGSLEDWSRQGVLLLNSTLTVEEGKPGSHQGLGWEVFTDNVIKTISDKKEHVVFILWGKFAEAKADIIDGRRHLIITSPHPSPFSAHRGFFGSKPFSQTNKYLKKTGQETINW